MWNIWSMLVPDTVKFDKEDGTVGFYSVKKDISIDKLKNGEYKLEEIIELKEANNQLLGSYKDLNVYLKIGKFGHYLEWGEVKKSLKYVKINVPIKNIQLEDAINILEEAKSTDNSLVRKIDENLTIRKGKFGDYIFYKKETMKRPIFFKLNGFDEDYKTCTIERLRAWIKEKHEV